MKRLSLLVASCIILLGATFTSSAQGVIVKGGLSYSNVTTELKSIKALDIKNFAGWHAGIGYQTESIMGFTFQPELVYNVKGSKFGDALNWKMSYLQLPINIQYGIDLLVARPFIFVSPYLGYNLSNRVIVSKGSFLESAIETATENAKRFEYGLGIGVGINFWKLQITGKYNWNFGQVANWDSYIKNVTGLSKYASSLELSLGFRF